MTLLLDATLDLGRRRGKEGRSRRMWVRCVRNTGCNVVEVEDRKIIQSICITARSVVVDRRFTNSIGIFVVCFFGPSPGRYTYVCGQYLHLRHDTTIDVDRNMNNSPDSRTLFRWPDIAAT